MRDRQPTGRKVGEIRPFTLETSVNRYAEGSVLVRAGHTHVLCTATIEESVPEWLKGKGRGWITAEYSMLPRSTHTRMKREREGKISGRTHEIQRLIGRALRATVDLSKLGERALHVDCDVIQADGGTRTASISGACVAVAQAIRKLQKQGKVPAEAWMDSVAAISVGLKSGETLVDLDYDEDSSVDVDFNYVMTGAGKIIEVQGTAERGAFTSQELQLLLHAAEQGIAQIRAIQTLALATV